MSDILILLFLMFIGWGMVGGATDDFWELCGITVLISSFIGLLMAVGELIGGIT